MYSLTWIASNTTTSRSIVKNVYSHKLQLTPSLLDLNRKYGPFLLKSYFVSLFDRSVLNITSKE